VCGGPRPLRFQRDKRSPQASHFSGKIPRDPGHYSLTSPEDLSLRALIR
jgi:hypothetical protein